jgi:RNA polymerase sigma-70 factor (ECF subfamily)
MIAFYLGLLRDEEDKEVFERLYMENRQKLCFIARKVVNNEADAEDAVQTCFLNLAENFHKYREQPYTNLEKLCSVIAKNTALDMVRHRNFETSFSDIGEYMEENLPDIDEDVLTKILTRERNEVIAKAMFQLEEDERNLMYMRYGLWMKPKDMAELLHSSSAVIRKKTLRCRNKLAKILEAEGYGEDIG